VEFDVTQQFRDREVQVNFLRSDGGGVSTINFPRNALEKGWRVTIKAAPVEKNNSNKKSHCGHHHYKDTKEKEVTSPPMQIIVYDENGRRVEEFSDPLTLSSFADLSDSSRSDGKVCFGYRKDSDQESSSNSTRDWKCLSKEELSLSDTTTPGTVFVRSETSHLTTFAVLLGSVDLHSRSCDDGLGWIAIASLAMVGSCLLLVLICAFGFRFKRFRAWLGGYKQNMRLTKVVERVNHVQQRSQ